MTTSLELQHFAVLEVSYLYKPTSIVITCTTNNPCHLTCYYTDKPPVRHATSRVVRGLSLPWGAYWCFVAYKEVEQQEAGDTLTHTFEVPDWSYCQTKWFCFRGTVSGEISPSVSALLKHHHPGVPPALYEHYITGDNTGHAIGAALWQAQTFTPLVSHTITLVKLKLYRVGFPGTITIGIRETFDDLPTGPDLCIGTTDANTLTTDHYGEWREIELLERPPLLAATKYAIVARALDAFPLNYVVWRGDNISPAYPRGAYCHSDDSGDSWTEHDHIDNMFEEWGIAI